MNLSEILARGWTSNVPKGQAQPLFKWEWLRELGDGLLLLSGANAGPIGQLLLRGDSQGAADAALQLASTFPTAFIWSCSVQGGQMMSVWWCRRCSWQRA